jgi:hypothetical protein
MTWPVFVLWALLAVSLFAPPWFTLYFLMTSGVFGGLSLLPPGIAGNVPLTTICAAILIFKTFRKNLISLVNIAFDVRKLGLLGMLGLYAVASAFIYPRLLAGTVLLYPENGASAVQFLEPTSSNITQPIYMLTSIGIAMVFGVSGQSPEFRKQFLAATLFGATVLLASGVIDLVLGDAGREDLLAPFHNAAYGLLNDVTIAGQKRVVGFLPEASAFGGACCTSLAFLVFNRTSYQGAARRWVVPIVSIGLAAMVYLSTSSSGYLGGIALLLLMAGTFAAELIFAKKLTQTMLTRILGAIGLLLAGAVIVTSLPHDLLDHFRLLFDSVLFEKSTSSSYIERNAWTQTGIAAFWHTDGIGVGAGSIRTSNWAVDFAASTGVIGIALLGGFAIKTFCTLSFPNAAAGRFATGLKLAVLPGFVMSAVAGTTPDPGIGMMLSFGLIYALAQKPVSEKLTSQARRDVPTLARAGPALPEASGLIR